MGTSFLNDDYEDPLPGGVFPEAHPEVQDEQAPHARPPVRRQGPPDGRVGEVQGLQGPHVRPGGGQGPLYPGVNERQGCEGGQRPPLWRQCACQQEGGVLGGEVGLTVLLYQLKSHDGTCRHLLSGASTDR